MARYRIRYSREAEDDIDSAYLWGLDNWGADMAAAWLEKIDAAIVNQLATMPLAFPLAPENINFEAEIRQLVFDRYRFLFTVTGEEVRILRCRGPFSGVE